MGFLEALQRFVSAVEGLPMAVMIQEEHLQVDRLTQARDLIHLLLPAYSLFAGRQQGTWLAGPNSGCDSSAHLHAAARVSLLDV